MESARRAFLSDQLLGHGSTTRIQLRRSFSHRTRKPMFGVRWEARRRSLGSLGCHLRLHTCDKRKRSCRAAQNQHCRAGTSSHACHAQSWTCCYLGVMKSTAMIPSTSATPPTARSGVRRAMRNVRRTSNPEKAFPKSTHVCTANAPKQHQSKQRLRSPGIHVGTSTYSGQHVMQTTGLKAKRIET